MTDVDDRSSAEHGSDADAIGPSSDESDVLALELDQLITDYFNAQREGRAPSVDDFVAQHPKHEHALRAVLPGASLLDQIGKRAEDATPQSRSGDRLGEYKLLGVLGRGGMGVVYEAVQETLGRAVALKVLPASRVVDRKSRERFMREAQAAASLQHPGIVPVYGVGEADGQVYYAMQRVDGVPLDVLTAAIRGDSVTSESSVLIERAAGLAARLRASSSGSLNVSSSGVMGPEVASDPAPISTKPWLANSVRIAHQVAEALSYAHSRGVLHRDVKPSNVMLDESGRAYVTDFGLCKTADTSSLTAAGDVVGTLRYVPPERFHGRDDARGDVYGVGMILYELLCSRPAFPQKDRPALVHAVTLQAPPRPRRINPDIPQDLERIVLTAIAKLPEERYPSAEALISDLTAFMEGRPIRARAPGKLYLARLFAQRNRGLVATVAVSALLIAAGAIVYVRDLGELLDEVEAGRQRAERVSYHARLNAAIDAAGSPNKGVSRSRRFLLEIDEASRDWLWETVHARTDTALLMVDEGLEPVIEATLDGEEQFVAALRADGVRVHHAISGEFLYEAEVADGTALAFIPGTHQVAVLQGSAGEVRWFGKDGAATEGLAAVIRGHLEHLGISNVQSVDADDRWIALAARDGQLLVIDSENADDPIIHKAAAGGGSELALFGGDGRVAHCVRERRLTVYGPAPGDRRPVGEGNSQRAVALAGARDAGFFAVVAGTGYTYRIEDTVDGSPIGEAKALMRDSGTVTIAITPDGDGVITGMRLGPTRIWREDTGAAPIRVRGYMSLPTSLLWPRGGSDIIVAGRSGEWRRMARPGYTERVPGVSETRGHYSHVLDADVDESGEFMATSDAGGAWALWDLHRLMPFAAEVDSLRSIRRVSLDVTEVGDFAVATAGEGLRVVDVPRHDPSQRVTEDVQGFHDVIGLAWVGTERAQALLLAQSDGALFLVERAEAAAGEPGWSASEIGRTEGAIRSFAHHRGAGLTLIGTDRGEVLRLLDADLADGRWDLVFTFPRAVDSLGIGTLAEHAVAITEAQRMALIDLAGREPRRVWEVQVAQSGTQQVGWTAIALDDASGWIVTAGADGTMQTWDLLDGLLGPTLETRYGRFTDAFFPKPGMPPVTVEFRGRVNHFERSGAARMREREHLTPTEHELRAMEALRATTRLAFAEEQLRRADLAPGDLGALERVTHGLEYYARYFPTHLDYKRAEAAKRAVQERVSAARPDEPSVD